MPHSKKNKNGDQKPENGAKPKSHKSRKPKTDFMNTSIFKTLKDTFVNGTSKTNSSIVELCIVELSSGNFPKAIDLSEELIKKDINDSIGWATKALSQAYLFDYNNNLFFLKSSLTALDEFKSKTSLSPKDIITVESIFFTTVLERTIILVTERIDDVIELRKKAQTEKTKANMATLGSAFSMYAGMKSESNIGKVLGYGGAVAGAAASQQYKANAKLLNNASKGVFGVAIANISLTIDYAITLKQNLNELDYTLKNEATITLQQWVETLAFLYQQVIENLLALGKELKAISALDKEFPSVAVQIGNTPEVIQFIYLSKIFGLENSIPEFKDLERQLNSISQINESEIKQSVSKMGIILIPTFSLSISSLFFLWIDESIIYIGLVLFVVSLIIGQYFKNKPIGKAGELKETLNQFAQTILNFKISSDKLLIENMIPQSEMFK